MNDEAMQQQEDKDFGARLRALRRARLLTQGELAEKAGLSDQNISRLETGNHEPRMRTLRALMAALGVDRI